MFHQVHWTPQKIAQRIKLITPLVYRQRQAIPPFRYQKISGPMENPPIGPDIDDSRWEVIHPNCLSAMKVSRPIPFSS